MISKSGYYFYSDESLKWGKITMTIAFDITVTQERLNTNVSSDFVFMKPFWVKIAKRC